MPTISGTVLDDAGDPVAGRVVRVYRRDTGALLLNSSSSNGSDPTDADFASVSLLLHMDGTNGSSTFSDSSSNAKTVSRFGDAQISTAQNKFGGASAYFDGTGDYLTVAGSEDFAFGTGDFTIECWIRPAELKTAYVFSFGTWGVYTGTSGQFLLWGGSSNLITSANSIYSVGNWYHLALTRASESVRLFVDGVQRGSTVSNNTSFTNSQSVGIAIREASGTGSVFSGYIDELRITRGLARYTANFTAPTEPFPNTAVSLPVGDYQISTDYTGECNVVCLDDAGGTTYNDLILRTTPV